VDAQERGQYEGLRDVSRLGEDLEGVGDGLKLFRGIRRVIFI
jgi:hypothetical protein